MTNCGATCWLKIVKKELSQNPKESKQIAIDTAIAALEENEKLHTLNRELVDMLKKCKIEAIFEYNYPLTDKIDEVLEKAEKVQK